LVALLRNATHRPSSETTGTPLSSLPCTPPAPRRAVTVLMAPGSSKMPSPSVSLSRTKASRAGTQMPSTVSKCWFVSPGTRFVARL
jgi:hypothetical protein